MRLLQFGLAFVVILACPGIGRSAEVSDAAKLAARIDARLEASWSKEGLKPTPIIDDATFLRRVSLDLIGRIPTVAESRQFLTDNAPDKRVLLIQRMMVSAARTRHMATFWRRTWVPQADTQEFARLADDFESWVAVRLQQNVPYDQLVREILTDVIVADNAGARLRKTVSPQSFYSANENKPENLTASAARAFLGINLDCAQCHDHPFHRWTRNQFWETAAHFSQPKKDDKGMLTIPVSMIPNTSKLVKPALLDGTAAEWPQTIATNTGQQIFAKWTTEKNNAFFAKNVVNRVWAQTFGAAIIEPLDDIAGGTTSLAYDEDLLNDLSEAFIASNFDLQFLCKALVLTKAYQLSAILPPEAREEPQKWVRMPVRALTGEQLYDSLRIAANVPSERDGDSGSEARRRFASQFRIERATMAERSIIQALSMMNGRTTADLADVKENGSLRGVANAPFLDSSSKVETLFLAVLCRMPNAREAAHFVAHVDGDANQTHAALSDVFWVLVNTTEFNTNH